MKQRKIKIKGNEWTIQILKRHQDGVYGLTDPTVKKITIFGPNPNVPEFERLNNWDKFRANTIRHELLHAFLYECGLGESWEHRTWGHCETAVDWFAHQYPEYKKVCEELGV